MTDHTDVLLNIKSEQKPLRKGVSLFSKERLPFPIPLLNSANQVQYPLAEKGVIYFNCYINYEKRCCEVRDESSMYALYQHGYFGKGSLSSNGPVHQVVNEVAESRMNRKSNKKKTQSLDPEEKLREAFPYIPEKQEIINDLYRSSSSEAETAKGPEVGRSFETTLDQLLELDGQENLKLGLEETFFLAYALGCMTVTDPKVERKLNLNEIWSAFCRLHCEHDQVQFTAYYAAYHYFRSKGWVVKSGTKYGSDFVLYKEGPEFYHSLFSVIVSTIKSNEDISAKYPDRDWLFMSSWLRVSEGVMKCPVICVVVIPVDVDHEAFKDPRVIQSYAIKV